MTALLLIILGGALSIAYGLWAINDVMKRDAGTQRMQEISGAVAEGAQAYLRRQYMTIGAVGIILFVVLTWFLGWQVGVGFLIGAILSGAAGFIGMNVSVRANVRTAQAATISLGGGLDVAFKAGAVTGMLVAGLALLGVAIYYTFLTRGLGLSPSSRTVIDALVALGFGASLISIFARLGGGIFTKGADVGGDLVGKVEAGIPEDDPRNPATIADNVGDNVGDCAGMAADLFETYAVTLVASIILGVAAFQAIGLVFPLIVPAIGVITAIIGVFLTKPRVGENGLKTINRSFYISAGVSPGGCAIAAFAYLPGNFAGLDLPEGSVVDAPIDDPRIVAIGAVIIGIVLAVVILSLTGYYTRTEDRPVKDVGKTSLTGPATVVLSGISVGLESAVYTAIVIAAAVYGAFLLGG